MTSAMIGRPTVIAPWIGRSMPGAYPNKGEGRSLAADVSRRLGEYATADNDHRDTLRHQLEVHGRQSNGWVIGAEDYLVNIAGPSKRLLLDETLLVLRQVKWDPSRSWVTPLDVRDFWEIVRVLAKRRGGRDFVLSEGRRVLAGIFERGALAFLAAQYDRFD